MIIEKSVDLLNSLFELHHERIESYQNASNIIDDTELKIAFKQYQFTSKKCLGELENELYKLDAAPSRDLHPSGKINHIWEDINSSKERVEILQVCDDCDDIILEAYLKALENNHNFLNAELRTMLYLQFEQVKAEREEIRIMIDMDVQI